MMRYLSGKHIVVIVGLCASALMLLYPGSSFPRDFCSNTLLTATLSNPHANYSCHFEKKCISRMNRTSYERLVWLRGYRLWREGKLEEAESEWQLSPQYAAQMLVAKITYNDWEHSEVDIISRIALLLDPYSDMVAKEISLRLLDNEQWPMDYDIFMEVYAISPQNSIIEAALALTMLYYNPDGNDPLVLFDEAMHRAPDNATVLLYGFRIMEKSRDFGDNRIRRLAELGAAQLPQVHDIGLTFGVASAFEEIGDYETAARYNLEALNIDPFHPAANLQQVELFQILGLYDGQQPWLDRAVKYRLANISYYQRLIGILVKAQKTTLAKEIYCEGISLQMSPIILTDKLTDELKNEFIGLNCQSVD